jgi:membrane-associated phospholipid phosphatase
MRQDLLKRFTDLGDPTLLLLGGLGVFFYLWSDDERRVLARSWALAFGLCVFLTITSKFTSILIGGTQPRSFGLRSPSGHVAIGTGFYGCCALMLATGRSQAARVLICLGTAVLVGMLAASRIMLGLHTVPEIVVGFAIGAVCLGVFWIHLSSGQPIMLNAGQVIALLLLIGVAHSSHIDGEPLIRRLVHKIDFLRGEEANGITERTPGLTAQFGLQPNSLLGYRHGSMLETTSGRKGDSADR